MDQSLRDQIVLLLTNGMGIDAAESYAVKRGLDPDAARRVVAEARQRITVAADYARDEQLGKAVMRLDDLYAKSIAGQDTRTALQAQRELNRLLGLYGMAESSPAGDGGEAGEDARRLELIAGYVLPLRLTEATYPVEEHVRIACEIVRGSGSRAQGSPA